MISFPGQDNESRSPMTLKAIIFDLDETLTDRRSAIDSFIERLIARYFRTPMKMLSLG